MYSCIVVLTTLHSQLIDIPTRSTLETTSLIDLIFVDRPEEVLVHGTFPKVADHDGVFMSLHVDKDLTRFLFQHITFLSSVGLL